MNESKMCELVDLVYFYDFDDNFNECAKIYKII